MTTKTPLIIVYLGRHGAGLDFTLSISKNLHENNVKVQEIWLGGNLQAVDLEKYPPIKDLKLGRNLAIRLMRVLSLAFRIIIKKNSALDECKTHFIFPMSSPLDLPLAIILRLKKLKIHRIIHDANSHPGEFWPDPISNFLLIRLSDEIITLSDYVSNKLQRKYGTESTKINHPIFEFAKEYSDKDAKPFGLKQNKKIVLFIGRIRKYKGLDMLVDAWEYLNEKMAMLHIVGSGKISKHKNQNNVVLRNEWISNTDLCAYIFHSDVVVFPYLEASQSGIIPIARFFNKIIVSTRVGGLAEQLDGDPNVIFSDGVDSKSLAFALRKAIEAKRTLYKYEDSSFWTLPIAKKLNYK